MNKIAVIPIRQKSKVGLGVRGTDLLVSLDANVHLVSHLLASVVPNHLSEFGVEGLGSRAKRLRLRVEGLAIEVYVNVRREEHFDSSFSCTK